MKHPKPIKRSKITPENLAMLLVSWENYKPKNPFNIIKRDAMLKEIRKQLAELNEENNLLK